MLQKIQDSFQESIQTQIEAAQTLPPLLHQAAEKVVATLLAGNKIIVCGYGRSYLNAQLLTSHLLHRYQMPRPTFGAVMLQFDGILASQMHQDNELSHIYRKQLQAVAKEGDLCVVFSPVGDEEAILTAIHTANNENLGIIAFTSRHNTHTKGLLGDDDLDIPFPSSNEIRILEGHQFCINLLCELIDHALFS